MSYRKKLSDEELVAMCEVVENWGGYSVELSTEQALSVIAEVMENRSLNKKVDRGSVSQIDLFDTMSTLTEATDQ